MGGNNPSKFTCAMTDNMMRDPLTTADGHTYEPDLEFSPVWQLTAIWVCHAFSTTLAVRNENV